MVNIIRENNSKLAVSKRVNVLGNKDVSDSCAKNPQQLSGAHVAQTRQGEEERAGNAALSEGGNNSKGSLTLQTLANRSPRLVTFQ